jgi:hypothetical protein
MFRVVSTMVRKSLPPAMAIAVCAVIGCAGDDEDKEQPTPFGRTCYVDVPCEHGLACADVDGRGNFVCASRCDTSEECRDRHGVAVCAGDGYCALDCSNADCPGGEQCVSGGWCGG